MVKLEGGGWTAPIVRFLVDRGVPVCAHLGFTSPSRCTRSEGIAFKAATRRRPGCCARHAEELAAAGAAMLVLELVPAAVARDLTGSLPIPTIGIGAGAGCSGQVLVLHDMLGMAGGEPLKFVRNFMEGRRRHRGRRAPICGRREGRPISRRRNSQLLSGTRAHHSDGCRTARGPRSRAQDRAGAHHGQPARRSFVAGAHCPGARPSRGDQHLRQSPAIRAARGLRPNPRTFERDCELLAGSGCDIVFAPGDGEIYPEPQGYTVQPPGPLAGILEGEVRPAFFTGVCTVVLKLFNMVRPATAVFGKKDYQQLLVIRGMVRQLALPIDVVCGETVRDAGGTRPVVPQRLPERAAAARGIAVERDLEHAGGRGEVGPDRLAEPRAGGAGNLERQGMAAGLCGRTAAQRPWRALDRRAIGE